MYSRKSYITARRNISLRKYTVHPIHFFCGSNFGFEENFRETQIINRFRFRLIWNLQRWMSLQLGPILLEKESCFLEMLILRNRCFKKILSAFIVMHQCKLARLAQSGRRSRTQKVVRSSYVNLAEICVKAFSTKKVLRPRSLIPAFLMNQDCHKR